MNLHGWRNIEGQEDQHSAKSALHLWLRTPALWKGTNHNSHPFSHWYFMDKWPIISLTENGENPLQCIQVHLSAQLFLSSLPECDTYFHTQTRVSHRSVTVRNMISSTKSNSIPRSFTELHPWYTLLVDCLKTNKLPSLLVQYHLSKEHTKVPIFSLTAVEFWYVVPIWKQ